MCPFFESERGACAHGAKLRAFAMLVPSAANKAAAAERPAFLEKIVPTKSPEPAPAPQQSDGTVRVSDAQKARVEELVKAGNADAINELLRDLDATKKAEIEATKAQFSAKRKPITQAMFKAMAAK